MCLADRVSRLSSARDASLTRTRLRGEAILLVRCSLRRFDGCVVRLVEKQAQENALLMVRNQLEVVDEELEQHREKLEKLQ